MSYKSDVLLSIFILYIFVWVTLMNCLMMVVVMKVSWLVLAGWCHWVNTLQHLLSSTFYIALRLILVLWTLNQLRWNCQLLLLIDGGEYLLLNLIELILNWRLNIVFEKVSLPLFNDRAESIFQERLLDQGLVVSPAKRRSTWAVWIALRLSEELLLDLILAEG